MKRNVIYINDNPYEVTLPTGGVSPDKTFESDWHKVVKLFPDFTNGSSGQMVASWCLDNPKNEIGKRVIRGSVTTRSWGSVFKDTRSMNIGFRPILMPLVYNTMKFSPSLLSHLNGTRIKMGSLRVNNRNVYKPFHYMYRDGERVEIDNNTSDKNQSIEWFVFDGKLIATDNLVINISYTQLVELGLIDEENPLKEDLNNEIIRGLSLGNGYVLMSVLISENETELVQIVVKESFLCNYIKGSPYPTVDEFLQNYDPKEQVVLEKMAREADALALSYRPTMNNKLVISDNVGNSVLKVMSTFFDRYVKV